MIRSEVKGKEKSQGEIRIFSLSSLKDGTVIYFNRESGLREELRSSVLDMVIRYASH